MLTDTQQTYSDKSQSAARTRGVFKNARRNLLASFENVRASSSLVAGRKGGLSYLSQRVPNSSLRVISGCNGTKSVLLALSLLASADRKMTIFLAVATKETNQIVFTADTLFDSIEPRMRNSRVESRKRIKRDKK